MKWKVRKSTLNGTIEVPASKSHTIRAILIAALADGESIIRKPLLTGDGYSAIEGARALGAKVEIIGDELHIVGVAGKPKLAKSVNMGNSGTGLNMFTAAAALGDTPVRFDGDESLRSRPVESLLSALQTLGAKVKYHGKHGFPPYTICGPIHSSEVEVAGNNSQYLSSLLLVAPLLEGKTTINVKDLAEIPYVKMTTWWLKKLGVNRIFYQSDDDPTRFIIPKKDEDIRNGGFIIYKNKMYHHINETITGDFSSATFSAVGKVLTGGKVEITNLDFSDPQGDKEVFNIVNNSSNKIDLNSIPDALPALAVWATQRNFPAILENVAQARIKETDRIKVMNEELTKMGAKITEQSDGMTIIPSKLHGATVNGHGDHRVVMALALAGMVADGETVIEGAEAAAITYPTFVEDFRKLGANIEVIE